MQIKAPTIKGLPDPHVLSLVEKACRLKAQQDLIEAELKSLKDEIVNTGALSESRTRISTPFGYVQYYAKGRKSDQFSDLGKLLISIVRELLKKGGSIIVDCKGNCQEFTFNGGDLVETQGDPYLTVSATAQATKE